MNPNYDANSLIELEREKYLRNKRKFLKPFEKAMRTRICDVSFKLNNAVFENLLAKFSTIVEEFKKVNISVERSIIHSIVRESIMKLSLKVRDSILITLPDGSHIRLTPYKTGIEISRIYVSKGNHGQGIGTYLMNLVLVLIKLSNNYEVPEIMAEIVGAVGFGSNYIETDIKDQLRFFQKFGFEVATSKYKYMKLIRPAGDGTLEDLIEINQTPAQEDNEDENEAERKCA